MSSSIFFFQVDWSDDAYLCDGNPIGGGSVRTVVVVVVVVVVVTVVIVNVG